MKATLSLSLNFEVIVDGTEDDAKLAAGKMQRVFSDLYHSLLRRRIESTISIMRTTTGAEVVPPAGPVAIKIDRDLAKLGPMITVSYGE